MCIICKFQGRKRAGKPNAHYIGRGQDGLGIEENIVCLCGECHSRMDNSKYLKEYRQIVENYLKNKYENWNQIQKVYKKY